MTWKSVNKVLATLGVLGTLAVVSGADFLDTFAMGLTPFVAPVAAAVTAPAAPAPAVTVHRHR